MIKTDIKFIKALSNLFVKRYQPIKLIIAIIITIGTKTEEILSAVCCIGAFTLCDCSISLIICLRVEFAAFVVTLYSI